MKRISRLVPVFSFLLLFIISFAHASDSLNAYFFYGDGCPHCTKELAYLQTIKEKYSNLEIKSFEIYHHLENALLLQKTAQVLGIDIGGVPFLVIGNKHFVGYAEGITSSAIENTINECLNGACPDLIAKILGATAEKKQNPAQKIDKKLSTNNTANTAKKQNPIQKTGKIKSAENITEKQNHADNNEKIIDLPILGSTNIAKFSLPVITIIIGILDGFNPCAMWTLLFLISLLLGMKNRKRMWILGTAFIIASASVYLIFMSAWLNLILFLGFVVWVRAAIGILALFGGIYSIKEFLLNKDSGCKVADNESRQKVFQKLKLTISHHSVWLALGGIIVLAFMVNLVELICSAGLPAIYTQILALNNLAKWQYYLYILLYIFFFMIDDLFVFFIAMITFEMTGITTKYSKYSRLAGGIIMLLIGLLLIFKPQWLMFG